MSELTTAISKIAKKYPGKGYEKKGASIYNAYRDGVMSDSLPVFAITKAGQPDSTSKSVASVTGYTPGEVFTFMNELLTLTKNGVVTNKLLNPKLDVQQAVSKKEFESLKPGILPKLPVLTNQVSQGIKKTTFPILIPVIIIAGLYVFNNVINLRKSYANFSRSGKHL